MKEKCTHIIDLFIKPKGNITNHGFLTGRCSNKLFKHVPFESSLPNNGTKQFLFDNNIGTNILNAFYSDNMNIRQDIIEYKCSPDFDVCYYFGTRNKDNNAHRNSQLWHHDSVGHRLKLFIALNSGWTTYVLKKSHFNKNIFNSSLTKDQRTKLSEKMDVHEDAIRFDLSRGDWIIFDTNAFHKGHTETNYSGEIIAFEFSNILKTSWMGKVGKRQVL